MKQKQFKSRYKLLTRIKNIKEKIHNFLAIGGLCTITGFTALTQPANASIGSLLNENSALGVQEKIYVHTVKDYFITGELLWFKLYYTNARTNKPFDLSKIAYIEVLDTANHAVLQVKAGMHKGEGNGSIPLPHNLASGNYRLRAYTNWMKNFDAAYFFEKHITIVNLNHVAPEENASPKSMALQFFPEGGNLVAGVRNKIGFKGMDSDGHGTGFSGLLLEGEDTLMSFAPEHRGMGQFVFTPQIGLLYRAVIQIPGSGSQVFDLPKAAEQGMAMQLSRSGDGSIVITVNSNGIADQNLQLLAHTRENLKIEQTIALQNGNARFQFNESQLGEGISHITLFNQNRLPVGERLYFKRPQKDLDLRLNTSENSYEKRMPIEISLSAGNLPAADTAGLSMAVFKLDSLHTVPGSNILHYLWLSSDIKGVVEDPAFYFEPGVPASAAADLLMLTQGWRRFKWEDVLGRQKMTYKFPPEIHGHIINGRLVNRSTQEPQAGVPAYFSAPAGITQYASTVSDANGDLKFEVNNFFGGTMAIVQTNPLFEDSVYRIALHSPFIETFSSRPMPAFQKPVHNPQTLLQQSMSTQVQSAFTREQMNKFSYPPFADTAAFFLKPDYHYVLDRYTRFATIEETLREYVAFVNVRRRGGKVELPILNPVIQEILPGQPLSLLDGVPIFDMDAFFRFDPFKLKSVEVVAQRYLYNQFLYNGIISWKTFSPSLENFNLSANALVVEYEGMLPEREFYSPVYDTPQKFASRLPDYRNVLQWDPSVRLTGSGPFTTSFYTSDIPGKYAVVVEGLSKEGHAGSAVVGFEVK